MTRATQEKAAERYIVNLHDLADMPRLNPGTGEHGLRSVSGGRVALHPTHKVACAIHGAMNAVNPECTIWRCLACGEGAYVEWNQ